MAFPPLQNDLFLRAVTRQPVPRTPVWVMRQAGRYLPEYRELRAKAGDIFSDILTVPDAMGLGLYFEAGEGPRFSNPVRSAAEIAALPKPDPMESLRYVMDAISLTRQELGGKVPLIGFAGSPWTLATYMVEGGGSKDFAKVKGMMFSEPQLMHQLLTKVADASIDYLNAQVDAGAQALMVFDTWGGNLSQERYLEFSLHYLRQIVEGVTREKEGQKIPLILFTKNGGQWLDKMADTGCDALGVDWTTELSVARQLTGDRVALQGNLDPSVLYGSPEQIEKEVRYSPTC